MKKKPHSQSKPTRYTKVIPQPPKNTHYFGATNNNFTKQPKTLINFNNNGSNTYTSSSNKNYMPLINKHYIYGNNNSTNRNNNSYNNPSKQKKRNNTARNQPTKFNGIFKKINPNNSFYPVPRIRSTNTPNFTNYRPHNNNLKAIASIHNHYTRMMNDPRNPYSTNWTNKYLDRNYNMQLGMNGFLNGVPVITLNKKKDKYDILSKKELKEKLTKMSKESKEDDNWFDDDIPQDMLQQFNTNKKNFYQVRKDITEESPENEDMSDSEDGANQKGNNDVKGEQKEIEFPVILKYFEKENKGINKKRRDEYSSHHNSSSFN